ncbi:MAG: plasmid pRiA4b ORF-3 family protein [Elusimicrobia bacterium]|nr:plasmid pRiA4b ORF-3 family protein [Elusimicrobiota bacterium]
MQLSIGILQLKITLDGIEPPIWRRILVPSWIPFLTLNKIIQRAMGWKDCHQHRFRSDRKGELKPSMEKTVRLGDLIKKEGEVWRYEYDFGDGWTHTLLVEKTLPPDDPKKYPICLEGARACPPEDCGGVPGYEETLEIIADPKHPEHEARLEWLGGKYDPEAFDLAALNKKLSRFRL